MLRGRLLLVGVTGDHPAEPPVHDVDETRASDPALGQAAHS